MTVTLSKVLVAAAASIALFAPVVNAATVGTPVTINEGAIPGALPNIYIADQLSGQYDEVFTATSATTFVTEAIFNAGNWFFNGGNIAGGTQVGAFGIAGYDIYAKFSSTGTFAPNAGGGFTFTGGTGVIQLYADPNRDTNYDVATSATGDVNHLVLVSGAASITDDLFLGSATQIIAGEGNTATGLANGNFELIFGNFALASPNGLAYFIAPRPFQLVIDINGNFQSFTPSAGQSVQLLNNSANAFFLPVPEPSMLALTGIALFAMGVVSRKRKAK